MQPRPNKRTRIRALSGSAARLALSGPSATGDGLGMPGAGSQGSRRKLVSEAEGRAETGLRRVASRDEFFLVWTRVNIIFRCQPQLRESELLGGGMSQRFTVGRFDGIYHDI